MDAYPLVMGVPQPWGLQALLRQIAILFVAVAATSCSDDQRTAKPSESIQPESAQGNPSEDAWAAPVVAGLDSSDPHVAERLGEMIEAAQADPDAGGKRGALGLAYQANGYDTAALASYRQAEILAPDEFEWPYLQALMLAEQGAFESALDRLDRAIEINPGYAPAWLSRGFWLLDQDRVEASAVAFEKAAELGAGAPAVIGQARVHLRQARTDRAVALLEPLSRHLDHPHVFRLLGNALQALGKTEQARAAFEHAKETRRFTWQDEVADRKMEYIAGFGGRLLTAEALVAGGQPGDALPILQELVARKPDHPTLLNLLAVAYSQTGQEDLAMNVLKDAVQRAPEYYPIHLNLAGEYHDRGDFATALSYLDQAIEIHPAFGIAHQRKGVVLMRMERYEEALAALDTAARYDARDPEVFYFAGAIESRFQRWPEAVERFRQAVAVDATFTKAHIHLARSLGELRRFEEARAALDAADALGTDTQDVRIARAWLDRLEASGE